MSYRCPLCKEPLSLEGKSYRCVNKHTFDVAKEGYVNLLPVNKKNNLDPGDNKEMVLSRENFLSVGYFDELVSAIQNILEQEKRTSVLDAGCGTGYYTRRTKANHYGIDISKHAVRLASMKDKDGHYAVASAFSLPFADRSFDAIINCFAPKAPEEYRRVLTENGFVIEVVPGKDHLIELKQALYDVVRYNEEKPALDGFALLSNENITYQSTVKTEDVQNLLAMTPYRYTTKPNAFAHLTQDIVTTFDFALRIWRK